MYRKLHLKMAIFCGTVTGIILLAMTLAGLLAFENLLDKNDTAVHDKICHTILTYLEDDPLIDYDKINKTADPRCYTIVLYENSTVYSLHPDQEKQALIDFASKTAKTLYGFDVKNPPPLLSKEKQLEFPFDYQSGKYLASFSSISLPYSRRTVVILYSRQELEQQILQLRIFFLIVDLAALILLFLFAWSYAGRMLAPLEENRRRQSQFVASASHELRSPLAVLLASADALAVADEEDRQGFHETIKSEGQRMSRLIDDMLFLASADSQTWAMHLEDVPIDTLLPDLYEKYYPLAREKGLDFSIQLPPGDEVPCISCDPQRIEQVLGILLDNAISYTPPKGRIILGLEKAGASWQLWVADSGPGVPDPWKEEIFQRFSRADSSRKDKNHFGLGLSIAREIIARHHGTIWVEDHTGGGAVFKMELPGV